MSTPSVSSFKKEDLTQRQLIELFRDVRKGFVKWHSWNGYLATDFKTLSDGRFVTETDPFVIEHRIETEQRNRWLDALRAIRHGRVAVLEDGLTDRGFAVAVMNYHRTQSMEWGAGAEWETCYVITETWYDEEDNEYEGDDWVVIGWDGYP